MWAMHLRPGAPVRSIRARLAVATGLGLLLVATVVAGPATAARPSAILLSTDPYINSFSAHKTEVEPDSFAHGSTIVSAFQVGRVFIGASANIGWATSRNGGKSWQHGFLPGTTIQASPPGTYARTSDPSVAYDARHHTWLVSYLAAPSITSNSVVDLLVSRSRNGIDWSRPVTIAAQNEFLDKNWTACDNSPRSRFYGNCYTELENPTQGSVVFMTTSTDGGQAWSPLQPTADRVVGVGGQPVVQPDGTVVVPIEAFTSQTTISSFRSTDGGASWSATSLIANVDAHNSAANIRNGGALPTAEIDRSGRVYVVWSDCRFEPSCDANDLVMSTSADGTTWTAPTRVPIDPVGAGVDHFTPGLGVDPTTSGRHAHLALAYYYYPQSDCTVETCELHVGYVSSVNAGRSWSRPTHLAGPMNVTWLALTASGYMAGDYISTSIVSGTRRAFPLFAAASPPTGDLLHENMYTARMAVSGGGVRAGTEAVHGRGPAALHQTSAPTAF
jgi:BNR repeat-like domain